MSSPFATWNDPSQSIWCKFNPLNCSLSYIVRNLQLQSSLIKFIHLRTADSMDVRRPRNLPSGYVVWRIVGSEFFEMVCRIGERIQVEVHDSNEDDMLGYKMKMFRWNMWAILHCTRLAAHNLFLFGPVTGGNITFLFVLLQFCC